MQNLLLLFNDYLQKSVLKILSMLGEFIADLNVRRYRINQ